MSEKTVQRNEEVIKGQIKESVRGGVEEALNDLPEKEAESRTQAARYERSEACQGYRGGHYDREKAKAVVAELCAMKLKEAAKKVGDGMEETLTYCDFPSEHWTRIRTNNMIERLNREMRRRTRVVGIFLDGNSVLMLVCARLRHVAGTQWGNKKYMNMKHLEAALDDASIAG